LASQSQDVTLCLQLLGKKGAQNLNPFTTKTG